MKIIVYQITLLLIISLASQSFSLPINNDLTDPNADVGPDISSNSSSSNITASNASSNSSSNLQNAIDLIDTSSTYSGNQVRQIVTQIIQYIQLDMFKSMFGTSSNYSNAISSSFTNSTAPRTRVNTIPKSDLISNKSVKTGASKPKNSTAMTNQATKLKQASMDASAAPKENQATKSSSSDTSSSLTSDQQGCLNKHNAARKEVGVSNMAWDSSLTPGAKQWAQHLASQGCMLVHSTNFGSQGAVAESLYMASNRDSSSLTDAANAYYSEKYTPGQKGHYQAMIRSSNTRVSCYAAYGSSGCTVVACRYGGSGSSSGGRSSSGSGSGYNLGSLSSLFSGSGSGLGTNGGYGAGDWSSILSKYGSGSNIMSNWRNSLSNEWSNLSQYFGNFKLF